MAIAETEIEQVKQTISLAAFIRSCGVELKRKGKQLLGHCPFHNDRTPSFVVDEAKGLWNCLGRCAEGGDLYKFVMKQDWISFPAAHKKLLSEIGADIKPKAKLEKAKALSQTMEWLEA